VPEARWIRAITPSLVTVALVAATIAFPPASATAAEASSEGFGIVFPVAGEHHYSNSWGAPRSGGRTHQGIDIFAAKGTPVVAAADGRITRIATGERAGRYIVIRHAGGWETFYLHLNNDSEGTDDGLGGGSAPGIAVGARVGAGDVIDYVGDSGNAEETPSHLHLEIHSAGVPVNPYPYLLTAGTTTDPGNTLVAAPQRPAFRAENVTFIGNFDPGGGFTADVAVHDDTAYLGTWGRPSACPGFGVRVIDVTNPSQPEGLGTIASAAEFPETSTDSVWVGPVDTTGFTGDLAAVAVRLCDTSEAGRSAELFRGLALYDVTDPAVPALLGTIDSGPMTQGVHEIDVAVHRDGSVVVAATVLQSLRHTSRTVGDLRLIDITDPAAPTQIADWDLRRNGPARVLQTMQATVYDELELHTHSATWTDEGERLWLATWDAGVTLLDTSDPEMPSITSIFGYDPEGRGNAHSVAVDTAAGILVRSDQDLVNADSGRHTAGWGGQQIYDISNPAAVTELAELRTENSGGVEGGSGAVDGRYSAHNAVLRDGIAYAAWYSDGLRITDLSDPAHPREAAWFIPPARPDPQQYWDAPDGTTSMAMVWGVAIDEHLVFVSDMNSGLWIVRYGSTGGLEGLETE